MRPYLVSLGVLFFGMALLIVFLPSNILDAPVVRAIIPGLYPHAVFAALWGVASALAFAASVWYSPPLRLAAQSLGVGVSIAWMMLLVFQAITEYNIGSWSRVLVWAFLILVQASSVRYYDVPPGVEAEAQRLFNRMLAEHRRTHGTREGDAND